MAERATLHLRKLEEFAAWAATKGFVRIPCKGHYEVLRLSRHGGPPVLFYARLTAREHATCQESGQRLVSQWLRERRQEAPRG